MTDHKAHFLPFHAVNEFLLPEYRLKIIQQAFAELNHLSEERRSAISRLVKRHVQVSGFRNSALAPAPVKARAAVSNFEKSAEFAAQIMSAWYELHPELAKKVNDLLTAREWKLLPLEVDRSKLPGFLTHWPKEETFEVLDDAYAYPVAIEPGMTFALETQHGKLHRFGVRLEEMLYVTETGIEMVTTYKSHEIIVVD